MVGTPHDTEDMTMRKIVALAIVAGFLLAGPAQAQEKKAEKPKPYRFTAFAVNMNSGPKAGMVDIVIERPTTDEERAGLIAAFAEGGQDALLKALQKVKPRVGYIRTPNSLGYDLQYAYRFVNSDGTSRIVIGTDRPINFWEASRQPRTMDYPFTIIEMRLDAKGEGEGRMAAGTKISKSKDGKTIELENYGISPVALNQIKLQKR
jgi:hypothetical protein